MMLVFMVILIELFLSQANLLDSSNLTEEIEVNPKICAGYPVKRTEFPFRARVEAHYKRNLFGKPSRIAKCGGSLITPKWVVTVAHCVPKKPSKLIVRFGVYNISDPRESGRKVHDTSIKVFPHDNYIESTHENDITLLMLNEDVLLSEYIKPVKIARGGDTFAGEGGTIFGWGRTQTNELSETPRAVDVVILRNDACTPLTNKVEIKETHLCTYNCLKSKGSCEGDSGGSLSQERDSTLIGLVSFVSENCTANNVSVFTRITTFSQWIDAKMEEMENDLRNNSEKKKGDTAIFAILIVNSSIWIIFFK